MRKLFIPILLGTVRQGRESEKVARLLEARVSGRPDMETRLFDPRQMHVTFEDEGQQLKERNPEWRDAMVRADGLVIVSPEYNRGYPGSLKYVLDMLLREYIHKAVGLVGVSGGGFGGVRVIESLLGVVRELGLAVTFTDLNCSRVHDMFDDGGNLKDAGFQKRIDGFLEELAWMSTVLRWGRENVASKYHKPCHQPGIE